MLQFGWFLNSPLRLLNLWGSFRAITVIIILIIILIIISFFVSFSHRLLLALCHWSLRDSKSSQFSRTHIKIQVDLRSTIARTVSIPFSLFSMFFWTVPKTPITIGITIPRFSVPWQRFSNCAVLRFLKFSFCVLLKQKNSLFDRFFSSY